MSMRVIDPRLDERFMERRRESGGDKFDEVWDGEYVMAPLPNDEHQELVGGLTFVFHTVAVLPGLGLVRPGVNVSDREAGWEHNFRCPDVVVYLNGTAARNCGAHWFGGPDFAVEVASRGDRSRQKFDFYAAVNTRELLLVDRNPWSLELYRLADGVLGLVGTSRPGDPEPLASAVLPLSFRLTAGEPRPRVEVARREGGEPWRI